MLFLSLELPVNEKPLFAVEVLTVLEMFPQDDFIDTGSFMTISRYGVTK